MPIFCVKSIKIYTGQKKFTRVYPWDLWQIWGMCWYPIHIWIYWNKSISCPVHIDKLRRKKGLKIVSEKYSYYGAAFFNILLRRFSEKWTLCWFYAKLKGPRLDTFTISGSPLVFVNLPNSSHFFVKHVCCLFWLHNFQIWETQLKRFSAAFV